MELISPDWPAPDGIKAVSTTRTGGVSLPPYHSFNMGDHVGDDATRVEANRFQLAGSLNLGAEDIQWLKQVHGTQVFKMEEVLPDVEADAVYTCRTGKACSIMTADCLPVLFASFDGNEVAAAHAGWRGLVSGVLESTLGCFKNPSETMAWLGPAIGPEVFEVGDEVRQEFLGKDKQMAEAFKPSPVNSDKWVADIYLLARMTLLSVGLSSIYGGQYCTLSEPERFYSYRRDGITGRMASLIWKV
ncbi:multi-copper polyphenol oxidoreductase [Hahella sp. CCB-MM4]|nr:multi-copper polyphenol oxidoreductase [Hahella sp. CCB-MM4]